MVILPGDIKFIRTDEVRTEQVYALKSPLTHQWMELRISQRFILADKSHFFSDASLYNEIVEYYQIMLMLLSRFRDVQALNHDVTSLSDEESRIFGVKAPPRAYRHR